MFYINKPDELTHWGIKGQKWGVRRYQNADGTLTAAGRKRLQKRNDKFEKRNPDKASEAKKRKSEFIENKRNSIEDTKKTLAKSKMLRDTDIDKIDFDKEAEDAIADEFDFLKDSYEMGYSKVKPDRQFAIDSFFWEKGLDAPKNATAKDVANLIKADTFILKQNKTYDQLIALDEKSIARCEKQIRSIENAPLSEIYGNRFNIYSKYEGDWRNDD